MTRSKENPAVAPTTAGREKDTVTDSLSLPLYLRHLQKLTEEHGLIDETIREAGLYSANAFD
jgi:hypothetical protein